MKRLIAYIAKFVLKTDRRYSTEDLLSTYFSNEKWLKIKSQASDSRFLMQVAANELGISEERICQMIGLRLGLEVKQSIETVPVRVAANSISLSSFRRLGAIPIVSNKLISGIACIEPALLIELGVLIPDLPLYLSTWTEISDALTRSEQATAAFLAAKSKDASSLYVQNCSEGTYVLVIEDDRVFGKVITNYLKREGHNVVLSLNANEAMRRIARFSKLPSAVICDVHMPGISGVEFIKLFQKLEGASDVPVVAITSDEEIETEILMLNKGARALFRKSEDPRVLSAYIRQASGLEELLEDAKW